MVFAYGYVVEQGDIERQDLTFQFDFTTGDVTKSSDTIKLLLRDNIALP